MPELAEIQIRPGMSEATDSRMLPMHPQATPRLLQNLRFRQLNRAEKRPGTADLDTTDFPSAGYGCWVGGLRDGIGGCVEYATLLGRTRQSYMWLESGSSVARWHNMGDVSRVLPIGRTEVAGVNFSFSTIVAATVYAKGSIFVAWQEYGSPTTVWVQRLSLDGMPISPVVEVADADNCRLVYPDSSSNDIYVVTRLTTGAGTTVQVRTMHAGTMALSAATNISATLRASTEVHDVAQLVGGTDWLLVFSDTATALFAARMTGTTETNTVAINTGGIPTLPTIAGTSGEGVCVAYFDTAGATLEAHVMNATLGAGANVVVHTTGATESRLCTGVVRESATTWRVLASYQDTSTAPAITTSVLYHATVSSAAAVTAGPNRVVGFEQASKPWARIGATGIAQVYVLAKAGTTFYDAAHYVLELDSSTLVAVNGNAHLAAVSYEHVATSTATAGQLCQVVECGASSGRYAVGIPWADPNKTAGIDLLSFYCALPTESMCACHRQAIETADGMCVNGGVLAEFSEPSRFHYLVENGFAYDPVVAVAVAAGAGLTADREYTYVAVYACQDSAGNISRSAPSAAVTVTPTGANCQVTVRVLTLGVSGRYGTTNPVWVEIYRSYNGRPYNRVNAEDLTQAFPTATTVTYTDDNSDTVVSAFPGIYTDGGVLPNDPPSGARLIARGGGRMFVGGWRRDTVQFSTLIVPTTPYEFTDADQFRIRFPEALTALGWLDGVLVGFSKRSIYLVTGEGPDDQGNGTYSEPRQMLSTVGADSPHVVEVPQGLMFKGAGTIWLLPRGFGPPTPVGDDIQETLGSFPYLRGCWRCSNADDDTTHFLLASSDLPAATTKVAVWDNRIGSWSLDDIDGEVGAAGSVDGKFTWLLPTWDAVADLPARQFSAAEFQDYTANGAASWIESRVGLGTFHQAGIFGISTTRSLTIFGETVGSCVLKLDVSIDHASATTWPLTMGSTGVFYAQHQLETRTRSAFRFDMYDAENSGMTAGIVWHALALEFDKLPGPKPIPPATARF
jgi:hypothetical protein